MKKILSLVLLASVLAVVFSAAALITEPDTASADTNSIPQYKSICGLGTVSKADPIVKPSPEVAHTHDFFGPVGQLTNDTTANDLAQMESKCQRNTNHSAYWTPELVHGGEPVQPTSSGVYYNSEEPFNSQTFAVPFGLKLIAHPYDENPQSEIYWYCDESNNVRSPSDTSGSKYPGGVGVCNQNTIGVTIVFPNCLREPVNAANGTAGALNRRHSACPDSHRRIPQLFMFINYKWDKGDSLTNIRVRGNGNELVGAGGMHADYFNSDSNNVTLNRECIRKGPRDWPLCLHNPSSQ